MQNIPEPSAPPPEFPDDHSHESFYPSPPPISYTPAAYQSWPVHYNFSANVSTSLCNAQLNNGTSGVLGCEQWTSSQTHLPNLQMVHLNANAPAISVQPPVIIGPPTSVVQSPPTYLGWSIFNFLCCFWPLGLAAIVYSVKTGSARSHEEAKRHSVTSRNLNIAATTIAPLLVIIIVGAVVGSNANTKSSRNSPGYYANPSKQPNANYYSYGYYTYLMYYTDYATTYFFVYTSSRDAFDGSYYSYSYIDVKYSHVTSSKYAVGSYN